MWSFMERLMGVAESVASAVREIKEGQKMHTALHTETLRLIKGGGRPQTPPGCLPEGMRLPLNSEEEFSAMESRLAHDNYMAVMVGMVASFFI